MADSDLDTELRRSAEKTAEGILSAARADAERLAAEADQRIAERRREIMKDKEARYGAEARAAIAAERHAAMRAMLLARTRVVDRTLDRARALIPEAAQSEIYASALRDELLGALQFVDDGAFVRCSSELASLVRGALRDRPEVRVETDAGVGVGFIVVGAGETVVVDGRLETRIDRLESALAIEILARLAEGFR
jgi:vacuolar-type H+-ATPase subunit E/Vma4